MIEKLTKQLIEKMVCEFNKEDNQNKLNQEILNPIFKSFSDKIYPYISLLFIIYSLNLIIIIAILVLVIIKK
jgi:hypothetical protein